MGKVIVTSFEVKVLGCPSKLIEENEGGPREPRVDRIRCVSKMMTHPVFAGALVATRLGALLMINV